MSTRIVCFLILLTSCSSNYPVTKECIKANKKSQDLISSAFGKNYHGPNKFKKKHF